MHTCDDVSFLRITRDIVIDAYGPLQSNSWFAKVTVIVRLKPGWSLITHDLAEDGASVSKFRIDRRHPQVSAGLELVMRILQRVMHSGYLAHSIAQKLAIVVQPQETRDVQFVHVQRCWAVDYQFRGGAADSASSRYPDLQEISPLQWEICLQFLRFRSTDRSTNRFHSGRNVIVTYLRSFSHDPFAIRRKRLGPVAESLQDRVSQTRYSMQHLFQQDMEVIPVLRQKSLVFAFWSCVNENSQLNTAKHIDDVWHQSANKADRKS